MWEKRTLLKEENGEDRQVRSSSVDQAGCIREPSVGSSCPTGFTKPSEKDKGLN